MLTRKRALEKLKDITWESMSPGIEQVPENWAARISSTGSQGNIIVAIQTSGRCDANCSMGKFSINGNTKSGFKMSPNPMPTEPTKRSWPCSQIWLGQEWPNLLWGTYQHQGQLQHLIHLENASKSFRGACNREELKGNSFQLVPDGCIALSIRCRSSKRTGPAADVTSPAKSEFMLWSTKFPALTNACR